MASGATKNQWLLVTHRYVGIAIAVLLIIVAGTGSVIAFYDDLERALNSEMRVVEPQAKGWTVRDALVIRENLEKEDPRSHVFSLQFPQQPDESLFSRVMPAIDPATGAPYAIDYDEVFANPYTGERLGDRIIGEARWEWNALPSFLYYLHYSLIFPLNVGIVIMGIVALIWAVENILGLFLTFPPAAKPSKSGKAPRPFLKRWSTSWKWSANANETRRLLDLHRSLGLWLWPFLMIFAVTGYILNQGGAYARFIENVVDYAHFQEHPPGPSLSQPLINPPVDWFEAADLGQTYFEQQAKKHDFVLGKPASIEYRRDLGMYFFQMHTSLDLLDSQGNPTETNSPATAATIAIDAKDGRFIDIQLPTNQRAGNTITNYLITLHVTAVGGRTWQVIVSIFGIAVLMFCVFGLSLFFKRKSIR